MQVKTKNIMVAGLGVALVLLLWYRVVYSSAQNSAAKAKSATENAGRRAKTLRQQLDGDTAKKKSKAEQISSETLKTAIPVEDKLTDFVRQADEISAASGVTWQSVTPTAPTISGGLSTINVGVTVQGSYAEVTDYLSRMLALDRLFVADTVAFTAGGSESATDSGGGPVGDVFAGVGAPPEMQVQISGRLFAQPAAGSVVAPANGVAPAAGAEATAKSGTAPAAGAAPSGVQNN